MKPAIIYALLIFAGLVDLVVFRTWGLESGKTFSWQAYLLTRGQTVVLLAIGYISHWLTAGYEYVFLFGVLIGHIFFWMRGAS